MVYITIGVYKKGDITNVRNYPSIMVVSLMEKLFEFIMTPMLSKWAEKNGGKAYKQDGFQNTI